jgi:hypothetical protein
MYVFEDASLSVGTSRLVNVADEPSREENLATDVDCLQPPSHPAVSFGGVLVHHFFNCSLRSCPRFKQIVDLDPVDVRNARIAIREVEEHPHGQWVVHWSAFCIVTRAITGPSTKVTPA